MTIDFNKVVNRKNTNSIKHDFAVERGMPDDVLPLWVADMDFLTVPQVVSTLENVVRHGIFGYSEVKEEYFKTLHSWFLSHYNWDIKRTWLVKTPGIVYALCTAIRALTKEGDSIIIQRPVYYPFTDSILNNNRKLINNSLVYDNGSYHMDFADFEQKIIDNNVKLFILCNPHNPVGRVWTKEELITLGDICVKHNVLVVSDEIHADFIYPGKEHLVFANLKPEYLERTITCTAPSKTFNIAGLQVSNIFIANAQIKKAFKDEMNRTGYSQLNMMGLAACMAAYEHGDQWLTNLKEYLLDNLNYVRTFLHNYLPQLKLVEPEGTYLVWIDFSSFGLTEEELEDLIINKAKLWLDKGTMFGPEGMNFQRINIACHRETLALALTKLKDAFDNMNELN